MHMATNLDLQGAPEPPMRRRSKQKSCCKSHCLDHTALLLLAPGTPTSSTGPCPLTVAGALAAGCRQRAYKNVLAACPAVVGGQGPCNVTQFAPCNQRRRREETHTEKQDTACAKTASVTSTCMHPDTNPPQSKVPINRQPSAGLSSYAREAAFRTEVLPTRPSTLPSDGSRQPSATEPLQYQKYKLIAAAHSTPMASLPAM